MEKEEKKEPVLIEGAIEMEDLSNYNEKDLKYTYIEENKKFKEEVDKIDSKEELDKLEEEVIALFDKHEQHINDARYPLPKTVEFEGKTYHKRSIFADIAKFLRRPSVKFQYVYGMYMAVKFWENEPKEVDYRTLDGTLRMLQQLEFKGSEWEDILKISEFFSQANDEYHKDLDRTLFIADRHNIILDRMKLICPQPTENE